MNDDELLGSDSIDVASDAIDGDITKDATSNVAGSNSDQVTAMLSLEELIKNHIDSTDKLRDEIKKAREMFEDSFNNSPAHREASEKVKEVTKARGSVRQQIMKQPSVAVLAQKVKDLRFDLNEQMKTLSDLLQDYHEQTGATQIETRNGQVLEIVSTAKLVRRSK
jgi:hypothetical protein